MPRKRTLAFTLVEMMVASSIFALIFGLCGMLYVQSTWRTANALELNKLEGQVRDLDRYLELTIENSTACTTVKSGLALQCLLPATGSTYDQYGFYNSYTPSSCSSGAVHWGTGKYRFVYLSNSGGLWGNTGTYVWSLENPVTPPISTVQGSLPFSYYNSNTNIYNWSLIDSLTFTINSNNSVTYTIHASDLTRTGTTLGSVTDTANSHTCQLTRTVYWRHSIT